jgi:hypothetical protein
MSDFDPNTEEFVDVCDDEVEQQLPPLASVRFTVRCVKHGERRVPGGFLRFAEGQRANLDIWALNADLLGASALAGQIRQDAAAVEREVQKYVRHLVARLPVDAIA